MPGTAREARTLRVATLNCLHGLDVRGEPGAQTDAGDLNALAASLAQLGADVIALQEVDRDLQRSGAVDQVAWLARRLDMEGVFAPALVGSPDERWQPAPNHDDPGESDRPGDPGGSAYGVGLLTRLPVVAVRRRRLPGGGSGRRPPATPTSPGWDREPRVALRVDVDVAGTTLAVTTTHLSYLPWRGLRQLLTAARFAEDAGGPAVLLGDLNLPPVAVRAVLRGWAHLGGGETYPAHDPRLQVDHVLVRGRVEAADVGVGDRLTSDHLPLVATLRVRHTGA